MFINPSWTPVAGCKQGLHCRLFPCFVTTCTSDPLAKVTKRNKYSPLNNLKTDTSFSSYLVEGNGHKFDTRRCSYSPLSYRNYAPRNWNFLLQLFRSSSSEEFLLCPLFTPRSVNCRNLTCAESNDLRQRLRQYLPSPDTLAKVGRSRWCDKVKILALPHAPWNSIRPEFTRGFRPRKFETVSQRAFFSADHQGEEIKWR